MLMQSQTRKSKSLAPSVTLFPAFEQQTQAQPIESKYEILPSIINSYPTTDNTTPVPDSFHPHVNYATLFHILQDPLTFRMVDRHARLLRRLTHHFSSGILNASMTPQDIPSLQKVLAMTVDKILVHRMTEFYGPVRLFVQELFALIVSSYKLSTEMKSYLEAGNGILSQMMEKVLTMKDHACSIQVAETIISLHLNSAEEEGKFAPVTVALPQCKLHLPPLPERSQSAPEQQTEELSQKSLVKGVKSQNVRWLLQGSTLFRQLTVRLGESNNGQERIDLLRALQSFNTTRECSVDFLENGTIDHMLRLIHHTQSSEVLLSLIIKMLNTTLEHESQNPFHEKSVAEYLGQTAQLVQFKPLFMALSQFSDKPERFIMRNELVILFLQLCKQEPNTGISFRESGILRQALGFLFQREVTTLGTSTPDDEEVEEDEGDEELMNQIVLSSSKLDYEFKILLTNLVISMLEVDIIEDPESGGLNRRMIQKKGLIPYCKFYLSLLDSGREETPYNLENLALITQDWNLEQLRGIQLQLLHLISKHKKFLLPEFYQEGGPDILHKLLQHVMHARPGENEADHRRVRLALLEEITMIVIHMAEQGESQRKWLADHGLLEDFLSIFQTRGVYSASTAIRVLHAVGSMCFQCSANKEIFGAGNGVTHVIYYLQQTVPAPIEDTRLIFAATECVWSAICGSPANETRFLALEGVRILLSICERTKEYYLQSQILGTLLELLEFPTTKAYMLGYRMRGDPRKGVESLLVQLWRQEENILGVPLDSDGFCVANDHPITPKETYPNSRPRVQFERSKVIQETMENLRSKIYGILLHLDFECIDKRQLLSTRERVVFAGITKYLDFKLGEMWSEAEEDLRAMNVRPVGHDTEVLENVHRALAEKAGKVHAKQVQIVKEELESEKQKLERFKRDVVVNQELETLSLIANKNLKVRYHIYPKKHVIVADDCMKRIFV